MHALLLAPLITWSDEGGSDEVTVIAGFDVGAAKTKGDTATVTVTYHTLGISADDFRPAPADETVTFKLVRAAGVWKIDDPQIPPHVSSATIVAHLRQLAREEPARRRELERMIEKIETASGAPPRR